jgi:hypothetical protein
MPPFQETSRRTIHEVLAGACNCQYSGLTDDIEKEDLLGQNVSGEQRQLCK